MAIQLGKYFGILEVDLKGPNLWEICDLATSSIVDIGRTVGRSPIQIIGHMSFLDQKAHLREMTLDQFKMMGVLVFLMPDDAEMGVTVVTKLDIDNRRR